MAKELEDANITSILLPYDYRGTDFSVYILPMLKATKRIKLLIALPAYGVTPEFAAKTFKSVNDFAPGRLDLNLISGNYKEDEQQIVINSYPGDITSIDSHEKRVALTEPWMEKFIGLVKEYKFDAKLCVVGQSDTTIKVANNYADYLIITKFMLNEESLSKVNTKLMFVMDPLILKENINVDNIQYIEKSEVFKDYHDIKGTKGQVINKIKNISYRFGINDFMIVTDQQDISDIFEVIKYLTK